MSKYRLIGIFIFFILFCRSSIVHGGMQFTQGWWKAELTGGAGLDITTIDRNEDVLATIAAEYEFPASKRITLGLRFIPLLMYKPDDDDEETVWGGGLGFATRYYPLGAAYYGWYAELEGHGIVHEAKIRGNTSTFNFLIGGGIGYRFHNNWHGAVKFEHISNGNLDTRNQSTNTISLAIGYTFSALKW